MKFSSPRVVVTAIVVVLAVLMWLRAEGDPVVQYAAGGVAAAIAAAIHIAPGGLSLTDRYVRRRRFSRPIRRRNILYSTSGIGTVWDGESGAMYVELSPRPFQVTVPDGIDAEFAVSTIPVDLIRTQLTQGDIRLDSATVMSHGYREHRPSRYNSAYTDIVGPTDVPTSMTTLIEVKVNLERAHQSVLARAKEGSIPTGLGKAVHMGAGRLERELRSVGYEAHVVKASAVRKFHDAALSALNDGFKNERWRSMDGPVPSVVTKPAEWTTRGVDRWFTVPAQRMTHTLTITQDRHNITRVDGAATYSWPGAAEIPVKPLRLRRAEGVQGDVATSALPLAKTVAPRSGELELHAGEPFPLDVPAFGLGVFLGPAITGGRVFMNFSCGGDVLYISAPSAFMQQLAARITTTGATVGVHLTGHGWNELGRRVSDLIVLAPPARTKVDVAIYRDLAPPRIPSDTAIIVWTPSGPPTTAVNKIDAGEDGVFTVATPSGSVDFAWEATSSEIPYIPALNPEPSSSI